MSDHDPEPLVGPVFDAHVHVWRDPPAYPDALTASFDGSVEQLLDSMTQAGVHQACIATPTAMKGDESATASAVHQHPQRFVGMSRLDCETLATRGWDQETLTVQHARVDIRGRELTTSTVEALCVGGARVEGVLAVHADPQSAHVVREIACARPERWTLIDHLGRPDVGAHGWGLDRIMALSDVPDIAVKTPNFSFFSAEEQPWLDLGAALAAFIDTFGVERVLWGSDWPLCTSTATYAENLNAVRALLNANGHRASIPAVLSDNARRIFVR